MPADEKGFNKSVLLPPELRIAHIREAIDYVEERAAELVDIYFEQANVFSGIVSMFGVKALDSLSPYQKHKHPDVAQQRFPDLSLRGRLNPPREQALESKGSRRPWALQSHYDHAGWYIVWRYTIDSTKRIKPGKAVVICRVDIAFLKKEDWKYEKSKAGEAGGGRTHTFGIQDPAKRFKACIVYQHPKIAIRQGMFTLANGD